MSMNVVSIAARCIRPRYGILFEKLRLSLATALEDIAYFARKVDTEAGYDTHGG